MTFRVHSYRRTGNIGDAIQTIALQRLLPAVTYAWRDAGHAEDGIPFVVNGWLGGNSPRVDSTNCLFAGVFINDNEDNFQWMRNSRFPEIGARDPATVLWCADRAIRASLIGCATMTLEKYDGPRSGAYAVDAPGAEGIAITHQIGDIGWPEQLAMAAELLEKYRRAELVETSRLHVALPCLAFGTPVVIRDPIAWKNRVRVRRFSILDVIGVCYGEPVTQDMSLWRERYTSFLERNLGIAVAQGGSGAAGAIPAEGSVSHDAFVRTLR